MPPAGALVGIKGFLTVLGINLGIQAAIYVLTPKPRKLKAITNRPLLTAASSIGPWRVIVGQARVGGTVVYSIQTGDWVNRVVAIAGHECEAIIQLWADEDAVSLDGSGDGTGAWSGAIQVKYVMGDHSTMPWSGLISATSASSLPWTANHKLLGRCCAWLRLNTKHEKFANGEPNWSWTVKGYNQIRDPRGPSVGWTDNAALCIAAYIENASWGIGDACDDDELIAAANVCDEDVSLDGGGTENRYTCNGSFTLDAEPEEILRGLLTSMHGKLAYWASAWRLFAAAYRSPTIELTDDDMRGPVAYSPKLSRRELANRVKGIFVSPDHRGHATDYPPVVNSTYLTEDDGEELWLDYDLPYTNSPSMAQRIAKIALEETRRQGTCAVDASLAAYRIRTPDVIQVTRERFSWTNKTFEVRESTIANVGSGDAPMIGIALVLRETDSSVYAWSSSEESPFDEAGDPDLTDLTTQAPPTSFNCESTSAISRPGTSGFPQARIRCGWTAPTTGLVDHYEVRWKLDNDTEWEEAETRSTVYYVREAGEGTFDVEVRAVNIRGVPSTWVVDTVTVDPGPAARIRTGTRFAELGGGVAPLTRAPLVLTGRDGDAKTLPTGVYSAPIVRTRLLKGKFPDQVDYQVQEVKAIDVSPSGFTIYAKNHSLESSPTYDTVAFSGTADDDGETVTATKAGGDIEPADDIHIVQFDVTVPRRLNLGGYPDPDWEPGFVQVQIHARPTGGGAWQGPYYAQQGQFFYNDTASPVTYSNQLCYVDLNGLGASAEFKITLVNWFGGSGTPSLTGDTVSWSDGSAPANTESATPNTDHVVECLVLEGS